MQNQFLPSETTAEVTPCTPLMLAPTTTEEIQIGVAQTEVVEATAPTQAVTDLLTQAQDKIHRRRKRNFAAFVVCELLIFLSLPMIKTIGAAPDDLATVMRFAALLLLLAVAVTPIVWNDVEGSGY